MKAALDTWREEAGIAATLADFVAFGQGAALEQCPALERVFTGQGQAEALVAALVTHLTRAIAANPLGHPPFRNGYDGRTATLLLAKAGRAQLLLQSREPGSFTSDCATFTDSLRYDATLAGRACGTILRIHGPHEQVQFSDEDIVLQGGVRLAFDCNSETMMATRVETRLVTLRLLQQAASPQPGREYCRETGRLQHQSAGSLATSRREMVAALLGRMERTEAAPILAGMALAEGDLSLRWQCLRECLALDTSAGFAALSQIAHRPDDLLSHDAAALRARLVEDHPALRSLEIA
ncbi:MAG TPA: hypothetical protein VLA45_16975 [Paracoccaceae bacterium]|nr:hypothetical protein [Paracoccaceae bacterium]